MLGGAIVVLLAYTVLATAVVCTASAARNRERVDAALADLATHWAVVVPDREAGPVRRGFALTLRRRVRDAGHPLPLSHEPRSPCIKEHRFTGASLCLLAPRRPAPNARSAR